MRRSIGAEQKLQLIEPKAKHPSNPYLLLCSEFETTLMTLVASGFDAATHVLNKFVPLRLAGQVQSSMRQYFARRSSGVTSVTA